MANPPSSAQLELHPYHSHKLYLGPRSSVGMQRGTDRRTVTPVTTIHFASAAPHAKYKQIQEFYLQFAFNVTYAEQDKR